MARTQKVQASHTQLPAYKGWTDKKTALKFSKKYGKGRFERLIKSAENLYNMGRNNTALSKKKAFKLCTFIETNKRKIKRHKYLDKNSTGLPRTIEYDPKSKKIFIHLEKYGQRLGRGHHKEVTLSILYHKNKPEFVANCEGSHKEMKEEVRRVKKIGNHRGIANTYAITTHRKKHHSKKISIIQRLYDARTMGKCMTKEVACSKVDRAQIAADFVHGLAVIHEKGFAHRDLHHANVLVKNSEGGKRAALTDFDKMMPLKEANKEAPRVEVPRRLLAPEVLGKHKHSIDVEKVEVYAAGLNLYHLFFEAPAEWINNPSFYEVKNYGSSRKRHFKHVLVHQIEKWRRNRRHQLDHHSDMWGQLGRYILKMCHSDPNSRPNAAQASKKLDSLLKKIRREEQPLIV